MAMFSRPAAAHKLPGYPCLVLVKGVQCKLMAEPRGYPVALSGGSGPGPSPETVPASGMRCRPHEMVHHSIKRRARVAANTTAADSIAAEAGGGEPSTLRPDEGAA